MGNRTNDPSAQGPLDSFKPLIRIGNVTYRIGRLRYGRYEVVRILDEVQLGTFECYPTLTVTSAIIHPAFIMTIARAAARAARPSWIYRISHALRLNPSTPPPPETPADAVGGKNPAPTPTDAVGGAAAGAEVEVGGAGAPPTNKTDDPK